MLYKCFCLLGSLFLVYWFILKILIVVSLHVRLSFVLKKNSKRNEHYMCKIDKHSDSNCTHIIMFYPLKVVGRGSDTQLKVGKNINDKIQRFNNTYGDVNTNMYHVIILAPVTENTRRWPYLHAVLLGQHQRRWAKSTAAFVLLRWDFLFVTNWALL